MIHKTVTAPLARARVPVLRSLSERPIPISIASSQPQAARCRLESYNVPVLLPPRPSDCFAVPDSFVCYQCSQQCAHTPVSSTASGSSGDGSRDENLEKSPSDGRDSQNCRAFDKVPTTWQTRWRATQTDFERGSSGLQGGGHLGRRRSENEAVEARRRDTGVWC